MTAAAEFVVGMTTLPDPESAHRLAVALVEGGAAACVQMAAIASVYRWQGAVEESAETLLLIKTAAAQQDRVREVVLASHPYELPELVFVPVSGGLDPYLRWIAQSTAG